MMKIQMQAAERVTLVIRSFAPVQKAHPPTDDVAHPQKITAHGLTHSKIYYYVFAAGSAKKIFAARR